MEVIGANRSFDFDSSSPELSGKRRDLILLICLKRSSQLDAYGSAFLACIFWKITDAS